MSSEVAHSPKDPLLGHLKESAVARLLVEGRLSPSDPQLECRSPCEPPMDLSTRAQSLPEGEVARRTPEKDEAPMQPYMEHLHKTIANEMAQLMKVRYSAGMEWKCCFCPYTAKDRAKLLSHYQFHQQLLTSSSPASRSHYEWLSAYRQSRDDHVKLSPTALASPDACADWGQRPKSASPHLISTQNTPHLRNLLTKTQQQQQQQQLQNDGTAPSASGFLRSIVQTIMQQNGSKPPSPGPPTLQQEEGVRGGEKSPEFPPRVKEEMDSEGEELSLHPREAPSPPESLLGKRDAASSEEGSDRPALKKRRRKRNAPTLDDVVRGLASSTTHQSRDEADTDHGLTNGKLFVNQQLRCLLHQRTRTSSESPPSTTVSPVQNDHHLRSVLASQPPEHHSCNTRALLGPYDGPRKLSDSEGEDLHSLPPPLVTRENDYFVGEAQEGQCALITRCDHCGITFDDEVLFSIHMGCHSHKDPFICNLCGKACENKYAFYTHIMRGHHNAP